eukprot:3990145-Amphidinium_carterae.1
MLNSFMTLVTDGLWCEQRRYAAGHRPTPSCAFCNAEWGTVHHVLWICPQWAHLRVSMSEFMSVHVSWDACASLCGIATGTLCPMVIDQWQSVQHELASIILAYQDQSCVLERPCKGLIGAIADEADDFEQRHGMSEDLVPVATPELLVDALVPQVRLDRDCGEYLHWCLTASAVGWVRYDFSVCEPRGDLSGQGGGWLFSRASWIALLTYLASLSVCAGAECAPTLLELYMDFMVDACYHRWPSGHPDEDGGGRWSTQLATFRTALCAFERLCSPCPAMISSKRCASSTNRLAVFGLPVVECTLAKGLRIKRPQAVQLLFDEAVASIASAKVTSALCEKWREWSPGLPQSQLMSTSSMHLVLNAIPSRRICGKSRVARWQRQLADKSIDDIRFMIRRASKSLRTSLTRWLSRLTSACALISPDTHQVTSMSFDSRPMCSVCSKTSGQRTHLYLLGLLCPSCPSRSVYQNSLALLVSEREQVERSIRRLASMTAENTSTCASEVP